MAITDFSPNKQSCAQLNGLPMAFTAVNETSEPEYRNADENDDMICNLYPQLDNDTLISDPVDVEASLAPTYAEAQKILSDGTAGFFPDTGVAGAAFWLNYTSATLAADPQSEDNNDIIIKDEDGRFADYLDMWFNKLVITGVQGQAIDMVLSFLGKTRDLDATGPVAAPTAAAKTRYADATIEVGGVSTPPNEFEISLEWVNESDFNNNISRDSVGISNFLGSVSLTYNVNTDTRNALYDELNTLNSTFIDIKFERDFGGGPVGWGIHLGEVTWRGTYRPEKSGQYWKAAIVGKITGSDILAYLRT